MPGLFAIGSASGSAHAAAGLLHAAPPAAAATTACPAYALNVLCIPPHLRRLDPQPAMNTWQPPGGEAAAFNEAKQVAVRRGCAVWHNACMLCPPQRQLHRAADRIAGGGTARSAWLAGAVQHLNTLLLIRCCWLCSAAQRAVPAAVAPPPRLLSPGLALRWHATPPPPCLWVCPREARWVASSLSVEWAAAVSPQCMPPCVMHDCRWQGVPPMPLLSISAACQAQRAPAACPRILATHPAPLLPSSAAAVWSPQDAKRNALRANGLCWMACGGMHLYNAGTGVQVGALVTLWRGLRVGVGRCGVVFASFDKLSGALDKLWSAHNGARRDSRGMRVGDGGRKRAGSGCWGALATGSNSPSSDYGFPLVFSCDRRRRRWLTRPQRWRACWARCASGAASATATTTRRALPRRSEGQVAAVGQLCHLLEPPKQKGLGQQG